MIIDTKFNVGDVVYEIAFTSKKIEEKCLACNGEKTILLPNGKRYGCPECYGDGKKVVRTEKKWYVLEGNEYYTRPIGEVRVSVKGKDMEITYLRKRTGCAGCPYGKDFEFELEVIKKYEPKLYNAVNNIFGDSYEYTRKYLEFRKDRCNLF